MKHRISKLLTPVLGLVAMALVLGGLARAQEQGNATGFFGWGGSPVFNPAPIFLTPVGSQQRAVFSTTGLFETVSSATYVSVITLPTPTTSTVYARCRLVGRATVAPSGGSIGDYCNTTMDFAGVNIGGTASIVGGPTIVGTPYRSTSLSTCNLSTANSGANLIVEATTAATGTIDGSVSCDWVVN